MSEVGRHRPAAGVALPGPASAGPARGRRGAAGQRRRGRSPRSTAASSSACCSSCSRARRPGFPLRSARGGLRSSEEVLAACAAGLAVAGAPQAGPGPAARRRLPGCCTVSPRRRPRGRWSPGRPSSSACCGSLDVGAGRLCAPSSTSASPCSDWASPCSDGGSSAGWPCSRPDRGGWPEWSAGSRARGPTTADGNGSRRR